MFALMPVVGIVAIFGSVAIVGFGSDTGVNRKEVQEEVAALLADIPQDGTTLGSPRAPVTLSVLADIECPTVRRFVDSYLPKILATWVRTGDVELEYRSLQTDTTDEPMFFDQEVAALAAGRQDRMWNYLLTFTLEQERETTNYATDKFLTDIALQVPELDPAQWRHDREDALLTKKVALDIQAARNENLRFTPSFVLAFTNGAIGRRAERTSIRKEVEASLKSALNSLGEEASRGGSQDIPALGPFGSRVGGE
jgi:protein-disulfide isomerase